MQYHLTGGTLLFIPGNGVIERSDSRIYVVSFLLAFAVLSSDLLELAAQIREVIGTGFEFALLDQQVVAAPLIGSPINRCEGGEFEQPLQRLLALLLLFLRVFNPRDAGFYRFQRLLLRD